MIAPESLVVEALHMRRMEGWTELTPAAFSAEEPGTGNPPLTWGKWAVSIGVAACRGSCLGRVEGAPREHSREFPPDWWLERQRIPSLRVRVA